ncbi:MAG: hypothetical protein RIT28_5056 [Pseudomonadota bacterium]|jgi:hypothetical protein
MRIIMTLTWGALLLSIGACHRGDDGETPDDSEGDADADSDADSDTDSDSDSDSDSDTDSDTDADPERVPQSLTVTVTTGYDGFDLAPWTDASGLEQVIGASFFFETTDTTTGANESCTVLTALTGIDWTSWDQDAWTSFESPLEVLSSDCALFSAADWGEDREPDDEIAALVLGLSLGPIDEAAATAYAPVFEETTGLVWEQEGVSQHFGSRLGLRALDASGAFESPDPVVSVAWEASSSMEIALDRKGLVVPYTGMNKATEVPSPAVLRAQTYPALDPTRVLLR